MTADGGAAGAIEGVLFDVDDTLVDTRGAFASAISVLADAYLPHLPRERHHEVLAVWRRDIGGHYRAYTRGEVPFRTQRMTRANELHSIFGGPVLDDVAFDAWDEVFETSFAHAWRAFADAAPTVDALAADGIRVGALSNAAVSYQVRKLAAVGLGDRVPMLVGVDTLGVGKPAPEVFVEACRRLGTHPGRTLYVGDELDIDAIAAVRAGLRGVWVDRPGARRGGPHLEDPEVAASSVTAVVQSLAALPGLVADSRAGVASV